MHYINIISIDSNTIENYLLGASYSAQDDDVDLEPEDLTLEDNVSVVWEII